MTFAITTLLLSLVLSPSSPELDSLEAWKEEALLKGKDAIVWNQGECQQLIVKYPGSSANPERSILLHSTSFLAARIHRAAIQKLGNHSRDIYWVVTCGGVTTATFVHSFFKKLSLFQPDLTTSEKVQLAVIGKLFPDLKKVTFVLNEGAPFDRETFSPWIIAPIGTSQRGLWSGRVQFQALRRNPDEALDSGHLNGLIMFAMDELIAKESPSLFSLRSLHYEQKELVSRMARADPFIDRVIEWFNPRYFFFRREWQWMLSSQWVSNEFTPFSEKGRAEVMLDYFFLGAKESPEIEASLRQHFGSIFGNDISYEIHTVHMSPFMRSVFDGREAQALERSLRGEPQIIPVPIISSEFSESRFFREAGLTTFEVLPLVTNQPFFQPANFDALSGDEAKASEIELKYLKAILSDAR